MNSIIYKVKNKNLLVRVLLLIFALLISAISYNLFLAPNNLVVGGTAGLSILFNEFFGIDESLFILIASLITLSLSYIFLGKYKASSAVIAAFVFPLFVRLTSNYGNYVDVSVDSKLVIVIIAAIISGFSTGIILKCNFSSTGISAICLIISEKFKVSYSKISMLLNSFIVIAGGFTFGINNIMYAIIFIVIESYFINRVTLGISSCKNFYIITNEEDRIKQFISRDLKYGYTELNGYGVNSKENKKVIMCVIPTRDYSTLKRGIEMIDKSAFFVIEDVYESFSIAQAYK